MPLAVVAYRTSWRTDFVAIASELAGVLGALAVRIEQPKPPTAAGSSP